MTPAFASALDAARVLLRDPDATSPGVARWVSGVESLALRADGAGVTLTATRRGGETSVRREVGDATVRDLCAWLGWSVPRPSPVGYDANGRPATDDGCAELFGDYGDGAS